MKQKLIDLLTYQNESGHNLKSRVENTLDPQELDAIINEYDEWDLMNCEILNKAFVYPQLFQMYSGVNYLGNVHVEQGSFQDKRANLLYCLPRKLGHLNTAIHYTNNARNTDLLPFDEQTLVSNKSSLKMKSVKKLFFSHSSLDAEKIKPLIDLIEGIGLPHNQIFFSSHPAYGVDLGENIFERLKLELSGDVFALFILSENFYKSPVCLCEMGAVWIKSNKQVPILIPPFNFVDVKGVFPNSLGMKINDKNQLNTLKTQLEKYFELQPIHITRWEEKRDDYLTKMKSFIS